MKAKGYLLLANWLIVIILILAIWLIINMAVSAFYHPNGALAPYYAIAPQVWGMFVVVSLILAIALSICRNSLSVRGMYISMAGAYSVITIIATIAFFQIEPVPDYFIQSVGNTQYKIPREFTSMQNSESGVILKMCIETLEGIYARGISNCESNSVTLYPYTSDSLQKGTPFELSYFFKNTDEFDIDGNRIILSDEATKYKIPINGLRSYTISDRVSSRSKTIHLQINEQNELIRFVSCRQYKSGVNKRHICEHWVKTPEGILQYELEGTADFDLELWQQTERNILNLLSQWKVNL